METRANYLLVGGFVLALVAGLMGFVLWFAKFQFDTVFDRYEIVFAGSVTGLDLGSPVRYSGVKVGEVLEIKLDPERPKLVRALIEVEAGTPIRTDTVASLELQGLTGGLYVLLSGGSAEAAPRVAKEGEAYALIPSRASSLEQVLAGAPDVLEGANILLARANHLLNEDNRASFAQILVNLNEFTGALAGQREQINAFFSDAAGTMENMRQAAGSVDQMVKSLQSDSAKLVNQATATLGAAEELANSLDGSTDTVQKDVSALVADLRGTAKSATAMADEVQVLVAENREPIRDFTATGLFELTTLVTEVRDFLVGLNRVTTEVERDPARFLFGNQQQGYEPNQ